MVQTTEYLFSLPRPWVTVIRNLQGLGAPSKGRGVTLEFSNLLDGQVAVRTWAHITLPHLQTHGELQ